MKIIILVTFGFCSIISANSRLIEKITDRTLTTETKTGSSPPVRLARQVDEEDILTGISKEENGHSAEFIRSYNRRLRHFTKPKSSNSRSHRFPRKPRESSERSDISPVKNASTTTSTSPGLQIRPKTKPALVKKPIPKYNEMDYDEDFQMKISKSPIKVVDSGEHEDEDFNLDDYDFDVNHDEFSGRGKPLEPRLKHLNTEPTKPEPKPVGPKIKSKVNIPTQHRAASHKKERSIENNRKPGEKEDYYDDATSTTKGPEKARDLEDEFNEDNEESKEYDSKISTVRQVRSPWKMNAIADKFGEKASAMMSKFLSILPMFPQVPNKDGDYEYHVVNNDQSDAWFNRRLKN